MKTYWVIGMMLTAGLQVQAQDCQVNVYVMTGVAMPAGMMMDARMKTTAMFRQIGVNMHVQSRVAVRDLPGSCGAPIVIQLEETTRYPVPDAFAYATPYQNSGTCIHVFIDRVLRGNPDQFFANALLAHVMVHEITHVLEKIARHSEEGVMKARWSGDDYKRMQSNPLPFAAEDVSLIHDGLAKRTSVVTEK